MAHVFSCEFCEISKNTHPVDASVFYFKAFGVTNYYYFFNKY